MLAAWPAAGPALALLEFFAGSVNATLAGCLLLGVFNPADEFVTGERGYVLPGIERHGA
jgi:hypothetical protein